MSQVPTTPETTSTTEVDIVYPKVVVLCINSEGAPEFHSCSPECTQKQVDEGQHYDLAKENASFNGFVEPMIAFDATDPAAKDLSASYQDWFAN